jgi:acetoin utilization protein AcuC
MDLATQLGLLDHDHVSMISSRPATRAELLSVHTADYLDAVARCSGTDGCEDLAHGLGTDDNPVFPGMHDATCQVVGGAVVAADAILDGSAQHAIHLAGGLHHAMPDRAAGFCIYNDLGVAIEQLLAGGIERVAYIDVDVHHGDGVEQAFWNDPRVLTISVHESGLTQFPGTGWPDELGGPDALGTAVNLALPAGTKDTPWLRAFDAVVPPLLRAFSPQVIVTQMGCDTHARDPLGHFGITLDGQAAMYKRLHALTHEVCDGRWITTGGGGYALVDVVPRAWSLLVAEVVGHPLPRTTEVPQTWRDAAHAITGGWTPTHVCDDGDMVVEPARWVDGHDIADGVDAAVRATRDAVFPHHGLDPRTA